MGSLSRVTVGDLPAATADGGVLGTRCGSPWWQCHQQMFLPRR